MPVEGSWRSHQVPIADVRTNPAHSRVLEEWLRSYRPDELFDDDGALVARARARSPPTGERRMSANPHANGGLLLRDLVLPDFRDYAVEVDEPGAATSEATRVLGGVPPRRRCERNPQNFRIFGPDETASNRLDAVFEATDRTWVAEILPTDEHLAPDGRVMEVLSEHLCQGWLEGYLLTGRHGLFNCYEAFIHIVDSMFNQHAKWLKVTREIPWRRPIASLNYLLPRTSGARTTTASRHQDPGFIDHVVNKKAEIIRVYLPPDANTLLSVADHCLRSRGLRQRHRRRQAAEPELPVDGRRGPPLHARARDLGVGDQRRRRRAGRRARLRRATSRRSRPSPRRRSFASTCRSCKVRVVNVVDLMRLQPRVGASARAVRRGVRRAVHDEPADRLRLPRLPVADPPPDLPADEPRQPPRPRLQGGGHDDDAVRHGHAQRPRPLPPRDRRHRPRARAGGAGRDAAPGDGRQPARARACTREHGEDHPDIRDWTWPC